MLNNLRYAKVTALWGWPAEGSDLLQRIADLAISAPRRILAAAVLVAVARGIFGIPVAKSLSASGFQDPTSRIVAGRPSC